MTQIAGFAWVGETVRPDPADFPALTLPVIVSGLRGPQGPQGEPGADADPAVTDYLQEQIDAIYTPGANQPVVSNGTYVDGVLHYTGGSLNTFYGLNYAGLLFDHAARLRVSGTDFDVWVSGSSSYTSGPYGNERFIRVTAQSGTLTVMHRDDNGLHVLTMMPQSAGVPIDLLLSADGVRIEHGGVVYQSPVLDVPISAPKTKFMTAADTLVTDLQATATGLLPNETAARIAGDAALQEQIDDVQTLAQVNQLNITGKADQIDLDALQTTVTGQGITLAQKADQTALDALVAVVNGKATPADITAAIAALVDGAPDALNTLSEIATALAGEQAQISDLLTALALRVRVDAVQSLTLAQQLQARQNINAEQAGVAAGLVAAITPASIGAATAVQGAKADTALQSGDVAPVALSGQYSDLAGLPTASQITAAVLTGLASGSATAIAAADSILQALEKLQAQATANAGAISTNSGLLAPVERKIGPSWYLSGCWYDAEYPRYASLAGGAVTLGMVTFIPRHIFENATFTSLAFYCTTGAAGAVAYAGIYSDNAGKPGSLLASISADCSTTGGKSDSISLSLTAGQIVWDAFLLTGGAAQVTRYVATRALAEQTTGTVTSIVTHRYTTGQTRLLATAPGTTVYQAAQITRLMLRRG